MTAIGIIIINATSALFVALFYEWAWAQNIITDKPKDICAKVFWAVLWLVSSISGGLGFISYLPAIPVALIHISLCTSHPTLKFAPRVFLKSFWNETVSLAKSLKVKWEK